MRVAVSPRFQQRSCRCTQTLSREYQGYAITSLQLSKSGNYVLASSQDSKIRLWDRRKGTAMQRDWPPLHVQRTHLLVVVAMCAWFRRWRTYSLSNRAQTHIFVDPCVVRAHRTPGESGVVNTYEGATRSTAHSGPQSCFSHDEELIYSCDESKPSVVYVHACALHRRLHHAA